MMLIRKESKHNKPYEEMNYYERQAFNKEVKLIKQHIYLFWGFIILMVIIACLV